MRCWSRRRRERSSWVRSRCVSLGMATWSFIVNWDFPLLGQWPLTCSVSLHSCSLSGTLIALCDQKISLDEIVSKSLFKVAKV